MSDFKELSIKGLYLVSNFLARDERGMFVKTFHENKFHEIGFNDYFKESYYSQSFKNVIRGMHFQISPFDHEKLVYVTAGKILDVVLDLRTKSPTYGKYEIIELNEFKHSVFIPKGCAHGFLTLSDKATVVYNVSTVYTPEADKGVLWKSFGFSWPAEYPIVSQRDTSFPHFSALNKFF